ncbi:MAG TPA: hypothetical protein VFY99_01495 [Solirubrobacterales bacterium]
MIFMEQVGPEGERLAMAAGDAAEEVTVGWDAEFGSATFDSDAYDPDVELSEDEVRTRVFAALDGLDPDWRSHLREAE